MGASKKLMVLMYEEEYADINPYLKERFIKAEVVFENEYDLYKDNPVFKQLYKAKKKADKDLKVWKFNQRHDL